MIRLSQVLRDGHIAGLRCGSTYGDSVAALGPTPLLREGCPYPYVSYGDLEIFFERQPRDELIACLIYLNGSGRDIEVGGSIPFDAEGLRWKVPPASLCGWLIAHDVPFSYDPASRRISETNDILLSGAGSCVCSPGLSEIYISLRAT